MVKYIVIFISCLFFTSCFYCDYITTVDSGLRSRRSFKKYLNKLVDPTLVSVDTTVVYKSIPYMYEEYYKKMMKETDPLSFERDYYYRFKSNGNYYTYTIFKDKEIDSSSFEIEKGDIGFLINKRKGNVLMEYTTVNCGGFFERGFEVIGDTLIVKHGGREGYRTWYYYVKHQVPKEWLGN